MSAAIAHHQAGDQAAAEARCKQALSLQPDDADCLHLLGVIYFKTGRARSAVEAMLRACVLTGWKTDRIRRNLLRALVAVYEKEPRPLSDKQAAYRAWREQGRGRTNVGTPLVSVVLPSYNHGAFILEALESVYRQTWPHIELIVIDDGSKDASPALIRRSLEACPFPHQFIARENRGAHATINQGIALAQGEYINILNSDDRFAPERIALLVQEVAGSGADWGFAGTDIIDENGRIAERTPGSMAEYLSGIVGDPLRLPTVGFSLLRHNVAISTGNLFVRKTFFNRIGAFADLRYSHDWEFVLRAMLESEPAYLSQHLYHYRSHGNNTINDSDSAPQLETNGILAAHIGRILGDMVVPNQFAPTKSNWGEDFMVIFILLHGLGEFLPAAHVAELAQRVLSHPN